MSEQRVTDAQAQVFAGYDADGNAWYTADPALRAKRDELTGERMAEFEWLRDLALDLLDARASVSRLEADNQRKREALEVVWKMMVEHGHTHEWAGDAYPDHALDTFDTGHSCALSDIVRAAIAPGVKP